MDVANLGLRRQLGDGSGVAEAGRVADVMVAAQADGEASATHHFCDATGDTLGGLHHVGGVDVVVSYVHESVGLRGSEPVAGCDFQDAVRACTPDAVGHCERAFPDASGAHPGAETAGVSAVVGGSADHDHPALDFVQGNVG